MSEVERISTETESPDKAKLEQLKTILPGVFADGVIDASRLSAEIGIPVVGTSASEEGFGLIWAGKKDAIAATQLKSMAALAPQLNESLNWDSAQNVFIEGDNLEVLKLLQKAYNDQVKLIYIDPPYNTGNDFVYNDDFSDPVRHYLEITGQLGEDGNRLRANSDISGRKSSKWLNMMYPRLLLARNLLKDEGTIFVSIDDNEVANLKMLLNEIFGEENFEGHIHWRRRHNQPNDPTKMLGLVAEHILVYARNSQKLKEFGVGKIALTGNFTNPDNDPRGEWSTKPWKAGSDQSGSRYKITTPSGKILDEEWMGEESTFLDLLQDNRIVFPSSGEGTPRKKYFRAERELEGQSATNWWPHDQFGNNQAGNREIEEIFGTKNMFSNPKPTDLIRGILSVGNVKNDDLVLDFFAGSGSTGHAVYLENEKDGGNRRFILVNIPEPTSHKSVAHEKGILSVSDLTRLRLRKTLEKIPSAQHAGLKCLNLSPSNFIHHELISKDQEDLLFAKTLSSDLNVENIASELLLKNGVRLDAQWKRELVGALEVIVADYVAVVVGLDLDKESIEAIFGIANIHTLIFLEDAFEGKDALKANTYFACKKANITMKTV